MARVCKCCLQQRFYESLHRFRGFLRLHAGHNLAAAVNQELGEVPLDVTALGCTRLLALQILKEQACIRSIDIHFGEDREFDAIINLAELLRFFTRSRLW